MVRRVCTSDDVKHNRLSRQLFSSSRRMATMGRWSFGHGRSLDYVFVLVLFLQCFSAATATTTAPTTTTTTAQPKTTTKTVPPPPTNSTAPPVPQIASTNGSNTTIAPPPAPIASTIGSNTTIAPPLPPVASTNGSNTMTAPPITSNTTIAPPPPPIASTNGSNTTTAPLPPPITSNTTIPPPPPPIASTNGSNTMTAPPPITSNTTTAPPPPPTASTNGSNTTTAPPITSNTTTAPPPPIPSTTAPITTNATNTTTTAVTTKVINATTTSPNITIFNTSIITVQPAPVSPSNITTTPALPTTPIPCNFSVSCNQTFYWMLIYVTDQTLNEQNVTAWLKNLDICAENYAFYNNASTSGNPSSLVVNTNVSCAMSNALKTCDVILQLRGPADVCCIRQTVMNASNSFNDIVVGDIERVGVCLNLTQHQKCNQSEIPKTCPPTTEPPCNCSSNCNSSEAYYRVTLENVSMNATALKSFLNNFFGTAQCSNTSDCKVLPDFAKIYSDLTVAGCSGGTCTVIVKLQRDSIDVCNIMFAIEAIITQQNVSINISDVTRVAMCSWSNGNPIGQNITLVESSASFSGFCNNNNTLMSLINCSSVVFLLKDRCYANQTITFLNSTTTPASTTATTEPPCNCSSNCNSLEAYYSVTLNNVSMNATELKSYLNQLFDATCTKTSDCEVLLHFVQMYSNLTVVECSGETLQSCTVLVKLQTDSVDVCKLKFSIEAIIKQQNASINISDVTRVAMCSWSNDNSIGQNITLMEISASFDEFCSNNTLKSLVNCSSVAILLNDRCDANQTFPNSITTPPSTTESTNTSVINADGLLTMTANASSLNSSQVDSIISQLEKLLSGPNVSMGLANTSVGIVNNLLDVPADVMVNFSKRANGLVDTVGLKLVVSGESEKLVTSSLALAVKKVNGANFEETSFSITDSSNLQIRSDFTLNRDVVAQDRSTSLGSITLPASLTQNLSPQDQQLASRVQFNFYQKDTFFQDKGLIGFNRTLISGILSASVGNLSISNLQKNVTLTLHNTQDLNLIKDKYVVSCVFWDLGLNGGAGGWKSDGCHMVNSSGLETQCSCNHLTSFGILLDISKTPIDPLQNTILTYITYIGCGISAIFLSITLLTYLAFEKLRKDIPSKILIHLCFALLLLNLVFLVDPWLAQYQEVKGLCISTAFFLHYFLLASFTWMAMEAVHMYLAIVKVFNTYVSRFMLKIGFAGWGIPLIVVIIVVATNNIGKNYGLVSYAKFVDGTTDYFCWIENDIVFYVAVVAYFCIVFLLNFTMFIVVLVQLCRIKRQNPQNVQNRSSWQELRSVAGLTVLLGLTWGFAFFAWGPVNLPFMYLFAVFNTFQGLFIFIFHCAMKENVRRQWRTYLCCGKLRLPEHSDWSQTQTQKIKKANKKRPSSAQSNNSSSSFLNNDSVADAHMGIGNPYDDTIITASEEHRSDVVLNEISNQNLRKKSY